MHLTDHNLDNTRYLIYSLIDYMPAVGRFWAGSAVTQTQPRKRVLHHAGRKVSTGQHDLDHADRIVEGTICPEISRSWNMDLIYLIYLI